MDEEERIRALEATLIALADDVRRASITWIEDNMGVIADTWSTQVHVRRSPRRSLITRAFDFDLVADFGAARRFFVRENVGCPTE